MKTTTNMNALSRNVALESDKILFNLGPKYGDGREANDLAFQATGDIMVETGFPEEEKRIARELFERSLHYQLQYGGFDWR